MSSVYFGSLETPLHKLPFSVTRLQTWCQQRHHVMSGGGQSGGPWTAAFAGAERRTAASALLRVSWPEGTQRPRSLVHIDVESRRLIYPDSWIKGGDFKLHLLSWNKKASFQKGVWGISVSQTFWLHDRAGNVSRNATESVILSFFFHWLLFFSLFFSFRKVFAFPNVLKWNNVPIEQPLIVFSPLLAWSLFVLNHLTAFCMNDANINPANHILTFGRVRWSWSGWCEGDVVMRGAFPRLSRPVNNCAASAFAVLRSICPQTKLTHTHPSSLEV